MFKKYQRTQIAELRPYIPGEPMAGISISTPDLENGSPMPGDMIARNPKNHEDQWLVAEQYFKDNFAPVDTALEAKLAALTGPAGDMRDYHDGIVAALISRAEAAEAREKELGRECANLRRASIASGNELYAARTKLAKAMKVIAALLMCPAIADEDHGDPEWGCEETAIAVTAARRALEGGE